jgi:hypothetical protein
MTTPVSFDFAVLGDSQPEGLLVASGLARKGFSVAVVPSSQLGELPPEDSWPLRFPAQLGQRRLDDLLFRAGFFRLEESGLVSGHHESQVILKKNRLTFDGSLERLHKELIREFPPVADAFMRIVEIAKRPGSKNIKRAAQQLMMLKKQNENFSIWLDAEMQTVVRPVMMHKPLSAHIHWLLYVMSHGQRLYRVDPKLKQPYHQFLLEHARKWGVKVFEDPCQIRSHWGEFQISPTTQVRHIVVNGIGGARLLAKNLARTWSERMRYWLYVDTFECDLDEVPEPLEEISQLDFQDHVGDLPSQRILRVKRDPVRARATFHIGSWLSFEDTRAWATQIEMGRQAIRKFLPFLSAQVFRPLPNLLELTEIRGECMRRGQTDRLDPWIENPGKMRRWVDGVRRLVQSRKTPYRLSRGVFAVTPHFLSFRNRMASFEESLKLLDHFEARRKKYSS